MMLDDNTYVEEQLEELVISVSATTDADMIKGIEASGVFREKIGPIYPDDKKSYVKDMFTEHGMAAYAIMDGGADHLLPQCEN